MSYEMKRWDELLTKILLSGIREMRCPGCRYCISVRMDNGTTDCLAFAWSHDWLDRERVENERVLSQERLTQGLDRADLPSATTSASGVIRPLSAPCA